MNKKSTIIYAKFVYIEKKKTTLWLETYYILYESDHKKKLSFQMHALTKTCIAKKK